jgi:hypothetical protein
MAKAPSHHLGRKLFIGLVVVLLIGVVGVSRRPKAPLLVPDCTTPAFKLSTETPKQNHPVAFTMVGPPGRLYVLGVDTVSFEHHPGEDTAWLPVAMSGVDQEDILVVGSAPMPKCRRVGVFAVPIPLGGHLVTMYELTEDRGAVEVARTTIHVTGSDEFAPRETR